MSNVLLETTPANGAALSAPLTVCRHIVEVTDSVIPLNSRITGNPETER
jgi:hypothetical protein